MKHVVVTDTVFPSLALTENILEGTATVAIAPKSDRPALLAMVKSADAILNCYAPVDAELIGAMQNCRIIARSGIGTDTIDIAAASSKGIKVTNVPDYCVHEVADHATALILALRRRVHLSACQTASGKWNLDAIRPILRIQGQVLGLVGFGKIGAALAHRAAALGMRVVYFDPFFTGDAGAGVQRATSLEALVAISDIVSLHAPLTEATRHMLNHRTIRSMRKGALLINTSRGGLIDTKAVLDALNDNHLGGVGLDVLEEETGSAAALFSNFPNAIITPHAAFYSEEAMVELQTKCSEDILRALLDQEPRYWLNRNAIAAGN